MDNLKVKLLLSNVKRPEFNMPANGLREVYEKTKNFTLPLSLHESVML